MNNFNKNVTNLGGKLGNIEIPEVGDDVSNRRYKFCKSK